MTATPTLTAADTDIGAFDFADAREEEIVRTAVVASEGDYCAARNNLMEDGIPLPRPLYERLRREIFGSSPVVVGNGTATVSAMPANGTNGTGGRDSTPAAEPPTTIPITNIPTGDDMAKSTQNREALPALPRNERMERTRATITRLGPDVTFQQAKAELAGVGVVLNGTTYHRHKREIFGHCAGGGNNGNTRHGTGTGTGTVASEAAAPGTAPTGLLAMLAAREVARQFGGVAALRKLLDDLERIDGVGA